MRVNPLKDPYFFKVFFFKASQSMVPERRARAEEMAKRSQFPLLEKLRMFTAKALRVITSMITAGTYMMGLLFPLLNNQELTTISVRAAIN